MAFQSSYKERTAPQASYKAKHGLNFGQLPPRRAAHPNPSPSAFERSAVIAPLGSQPGNPD
eukprot:361921-Chlamydomonas_euryale.AAC.20